MDVFKNPKNVGEIENPDGIGTVGNASCGDIMQISLKIENFRVRGGYRNKFYRYRNG